uniref:glycine--tRNA ligase n=2 Tax=Tetraselmis sp. GSL018 TaxID=582737 RepID=A0A061RBF6_9CHLO
MPAKGTAAPLVLEIGCEELPPSDLDDAVESLRRSLPALLEELSLPHGKVVVEGTPRRVAAVVADVAAYQDDKEERLRGPPATAAFKDGQPTKALEGFARKNGVSVEDVVVEADAKGTEYCYACVRTMGRPAPEVLSERIGGLVSGIAFRKSMRWNGGLAFSRPVRWLLALHGACPLPAAVGPLTGGSTTRVLRGAETPELAVRDAAAYAGTMRSSGIILSTEERRCAIWEAVRAAAAAVGGAVPTSSRTDLLLEVANLVESPAIVTGSFEERFLVLPRELLVMVMRKHQRYFPVVAAGSEDDDDGELIPHFITVANGPVNKDVVAAGNEAVLRARFEDAVFFYEADRRRGLQAMKPSLAGTLFQAELGSMLDKTQRVEALVEPLSSLMSGAAFSEALPAAKRAAGLAKADLASSVVMEMTALAGLMGRHYANLEGEEPAVAEAIFESVLPRNAFDRTAHTPAGIIVAVADRLDSLVGLMAAGCAPTANTDPYALRRTAYAMLQTLVSNGVGLNLGEAVKAAAALQPVESTQETLSSVLDFVERRLEQLLVDRGIPIEAVRAVLAERGSNPALAEVTASALSNEISKGEDSPLPAAMRSLSRPIRIIRGKEFDLSAVVQPELFESDDEKRLWDAYCAAAEHKSEQMAVGEFLETVSALSNPVDAFFDKVFVMAEDEAVRTNRLTMLRKVAELQNGIVDLSHLPGF